MAMEDDSEIIIMNIAPDVRCWNCYSNRWSMCTVNTRMNWDLATKNKLKFYWGRSECLDCSQAIRWLIDPDESYPESDEPNDPFPIKSS